MTEVVPEYPTKEKMLEFVETLRSAIINDTGAHSFLIHFVTEHPKAEPHHPDRQVRLLGAVCPADFILMMNSLAQSQARLAQDCLPDHIMLEMIAKHTGKPN